MNTICSLVIFKECYYCSYGYARKKKTHTLRSKITRLKQYFIENLVKVQLVFEGFLTNERSV